MFFLVKKDKPHQLTMVTFLSKHVSQSISKYHFLVQKNEKCPHN
jgi:hypothetical protein